MVVVTLLAKCFLILFRFNQGFNKCVKRGLKYVIENFISVKSIRKLAKVEENEKFVEMNILQVW